MAAPGGGGGDDEPGAPWGPGSRPAPSESRLGRWRAAAERACTGYRGRRRVYFYTTVRAAGYDGYARVCTPSLPGYPVGIVPGYGTMYQYGYPVLKYPGAGYGYGTARAHGPRAGPSIR